MPAALIFFKEIDGHAQVHITHAVNGEAYGIFAGIKDAVLAGAVILEFQQIVAVIQRVDVFGFAGVDEFLRHDQFLLKDMHRLGQLRQECGFLMDMWTQTSSD